MVVDALGATGLFKAWEGLPKGPALESSIPLALSASKWGERELGSLGTLSNPCLKARPDQG